MYTGIEATIRRGYTGNDHLIDPNDEAAATRAVAGQSFRRKAEAIEAAEQAYLASCDRRVRTARVQVTLRDASGDEITVG
jgi:hypothetical protein